MTSKALKWIGAGVAPVIGILMASGMVWQASDAVFSAQTETAGNSWTSGTVLLEDNDGGTATLVMSNLVPGETQDSCIQVTYTGSSFNIDPIKLYSAITNDDNSFSTHIDLVIEEGSGGSFGDCTGFSATSSLYTGTLSGLASAHSDYGTGLTGFKPISGSTTRSYRISGTLGADTPNASQGDNATATLTWEIHSA